MDGEYFPVFLFTLVTTLVVWFQEIPSRRARVSVMLGAMLVAITLVLASEAWYVPPSTPRSVGRLVVGSIVAAGLPVALGAFIASIRRRGRVHRAAVLVGALGAVSIAVPPCMIAGAICAFFLFGEGRF